MARKSDSRAAGRPGTFKVVVLKWERKDGAAIDPNQDDSLQEERTDEQIGAALGTSPRTISRVRRLLVTEGFDVALFRRRQPPRPDKIRIKGDIEQRLIELACSDPPKGRCHWTLQLLADELVVLGLIDRVSVETVRQALK